ncbi:glutamyl-tRNA(Gln) amidotransferase subunit F PWA37_000392 [Arxiozyma heterogenica]
MSSNNLRKFSAIRLLKILRRRQLYSTKFQSNTIGIMFKSQEDINKFFETNFWNSEKVLLDNQSTPNGTKSSKAINPSNELIFKLLKLSGLSQKDVDIEEIRNTLKKQIQFINILQNIELTEKETFYDTNNARLLPRENTSLKYDNLLELIEKQKGSVRPSEISGSWKPTSLASKSMNGYYVLEHGQIKNRK